MEPTSRLDEIQIWFVATDKNIHSYAGPTFYSGGEDLARGVAESVPTGFIFFFVRVTTDVEEAMPMVDTYNYVGKYDSLMVYEQSGTGNRWSVELGEWVDPKTNKFTSWIDEDDRPELAEWLAEHVSELPHDGYWVNINEP